VIDNAKLARDLGAVTRAMGALLGSDAWKSVGDAARQGWGLASEIAGLELFHVRLERRLHSIRLAAAAQQCSLARHVPETNYDGTRPQDQG
jgi:hypothetical protein